MLQICLARIRYQMLTFNSLIAILLGRLRLSVHDCIKLYEEVAEDIFGVEQPITATTRFSSKRFKDVLQKRIRGILNVKHDETFLQDPKVAIGKGCPMLVKILCACLKLLTN